MISKILIVIGLFAAIFIAYGFMVSGNALGSLVWLLIIAVTSGMIVLINKRINR